MIFSNNLELKVLRFVKLVFFLVWFGAIWFSEVVCDAVGCSESLFYFVPQESHRQEWARLLCNVQSKCAGDRDILVLHRTAPARHSSNLGSVISWSKWENDCFNGFSIVVIASLLTPPPPPPQWCKPSRAQIGRWGEKQGSENISYLGPPCAQTAWQAPSHTHTHGDMTGTLFVISAFHNNAQLPLQHNTMHTALVCTAIWI